MDKLVLQAVEEVALEGPDGNDAPPPDESRTHFSPHYTKAIVVQVVPRITSGAC